MPKSNRLILKYYPLTMEIGASLCKAFRQYLKENITTVLAKDTEGKALLSKGRMMVFLSIT